jgi:hypothetical protein
MWEARDRGKIEGTIESLSRLLNCSKEEFERFLKESEFYHFDDLVTHANGKVTLINRRMQRDQKDRNQNRIRQDRFRQRQQSEHSNATDNAEVTPPSSSSSSSTTSTSNKKEKKKDSLFETFWEAYPKKKSKGDAEKAWSKIKPDEHLLATMLATIERAKTSDDWTRDQGKYIPYPATWLNAKGWEDSFETEINPKTHKQYGAESLLKKVLQEEADEKARQEGIHSGVGEDGGSGGRIPIGSKN